MRILVATDAWRPQVNGVVRTYEQLQENLPALDVDVHFLTPSDFPSFPCPTYSEIQLARPTRQNLSKKINDCAPDAIHVATEGPIGWMTRNYCLREKIPFTTSFHTRFPEYLSARFMIPTPLSWSILRRFHNASDGVMVATRSLADELRKRGFKNILPWTRGVDTELFKPRPVRIFGPDPVFIYVGRVAVEKNLEAFLALDLPGRKVVVGCGPSLETLKSIFPDVIFAGKKTGVELAECYASGDVFVFPSRTDTFGIVLLEAIASGLPVAAFPVTGPIDIITNRNIGVLSENLRDAALAARDIDPKKVCAEAARYSHESMARMFLANISQAAETNPNRQPRKRKFGAVKRPRSA